MLKSLRPIAQEFIEKRLVTRPFAAGDVIYEEGARATHAIFPHSGRLSLMAVMTSGRSVDKLSVGHEGFVGLELVLDGEQTTSRTIARVPGHASWLSVADLDEAIARFECVTPTMLHFAKALIVQTMESVACNSLHVADQRVARWLLHARDSATSDTLEITQQAIAESLGLRRATVNQICNSFFAAGVIDHSRGSILIRDRAALEERSCECHGRIRRAFEAASAAAPAGLGVSEADAAI